MQMIYSCLPNFLASVLLHVVAPLQFAYYINYMATEFVLKIYKNNFT